MILEIFWSITSTLFQPKILKELLLLFKYFRKKAKLLRIPFPPSLPCDFIIQIGDNSDLSIVPGDCENRCVGIFTIFQSVLIDELLVDTLRILRVFHIIQNLLALNIVIHDVFEKISIDFQTFNMIWVDLPQLIELLSDLLYSLGNLRPHILDFLNFRIFLE